MTEIDKKKRNFSILAGYHFLAIEERYKGTTYKEIVNKIRQKFGVEFAISTIKNWFCHVGGLHDCYRDYSDQMIKLEKEETDDFIKGNIKNAAKTLAFVMATGTDSAKVNAAKEFLERGMGKVKEEHEHSGSIAVGVLDILRAKEELEKQKQDGQNTENT